jgi:hypothetical protein
LCSSSFFDSSQQIWLPFVWYDETPNKNIAISYYTVEKNLQNTRKDKVWIKSPFTSNFTVENPYTANALFSRSSVTQQGMTLFRVPPLQKLYIDKILVSVLWLRDHLSYSNQAVLTTTEFYRCSPTNGEGDSYLLFPLYANRGYRGRRNPTVLYHSRSIENTLMTSIPEVAQTLTQVFGVFVNTFKVVMMDKLNYMVQFTEFPACFL